MDNDRPSDRKSEQPDESDGAREPAGPDAPADEVADDDGILSIDLEDLPDEHDAVTPHEDMLVITLEDLGDVADEPPAPAAAGLYPGVDAKMLQAEKAAGEIEMRCLCSESGGPFVVYWHEAQPGIYAISRVDGRVAEVSGDGGGAVSEIAGTFSLDGFEGCPHCGCPRLSVCEACGTTNCEGATQSTIFPPMRTLRCPSCGNRGHLQSQAPAAYGSRGGKGKKGSK